MESNLRGVWLVAAVFSASALSACANSPSRLADAPDTPGQPGTTELLLATNHPTALAAKERLLQARERETIARADFLPEVSLTASETAYAQDVTTTTPRSSGQNLALSVSISLSRAFAGASGAKAAHFATQAQGEALRRSVDQTIIELAVEKTGLERTIRTEQVRVEHKKQLNMFLGRQTQRYEAGQISATELEIIRARIKFVESELVRLRTERASHTAKLRALAGDIALDEINLVDLSPFVPVSEQQATAVAVSRNPTLREAEWLQNAASQNVNKTERGLLPDLSLSFNSSLYNNHYSTSTSTTGNESNVRLDLRVPLFDGGRKLAELKLAKSQLREQTYIAQAQKRSTQSDVSWQWQGVMAAREIQTLAASRVEINQNVLSDTLKAERVGVRSDNQVLDAFESLTESRIALLDAQSQVIIHNHELISTIGILSEAYGAK